METWFSIVFQFWFAIYNGFSGQPIFERWTLALYNVVGGEEGGVGRREGWGGGRGGEEGGVRRRRGGSWVGLIDEN